MIPHFNNGMQPRMFYSPNAKGEAVGTYPNNEAELFALAATRQLSGLFFINNLCPIS